MEISSKDQEDIWIRSGVAAFLSLRYWSLIINYKQFLADIINYLRYI